MKFFLTAISLFLAYPGFAQHPDFWSVDEESGLSSNVVYDLLEDSKGYIWIGTDRGLVRYNGQTLETFTSASQKSLAITGLHEHDYGRVWGVNFSQHVFYVASDSMIELKLPLEREEIQGHIKAVLIGDMLYVYSYNHADRLNTETMEWDIDFYQVNWPLTNNGTTRKVLYSISGNDDVYALSFSEVLHHVKNDEITHKVSVPKKSGYHRSCWFQENQVLVPHGFLPILKYDSETGDTTSIPVSYQAHSMSTRVLVCLDDGAGNLWLCTSEGARIIESEAVVFPRQLFFSEYQISRVIKDREGNWWFSTLQHGVKVISGVEIVTHDEENSDLEFTEISSLGIDSEGRVLIGSYDGRVQKVGLDGKLSATIDLNFRKEVNGFVEFDGQSWAFGEQIVSLDNGTVKNLNRPVSIKQVEEVGNNALAIVSSEGFAVTDFSGNRPKIPVNWKLSESIESRGILLKRGTGMRKFQSVGQEQDFYLASTQGLVFHSYGVETELLADDGSSIYSLDLAIDNQGLLWVSTVSQGILAFNGVRLEQSIKPDLFGEAVQFSDIEVHDGKIWVASSTGLFRINPEDQKYEKFDESDGLPTKSINDLVVANGFVWLGTMKGLVKIPLDHTSVNSNPPILALGKVMVNNKDVVLTEDLAHTQNNVTFKLDAIALRSRGSGKILYRLSGLNDSWQEVPMAENEIRFLALAPGEYTFDTKLLNEDGYESELISTSFTITPPFWQTWWFYLFVVIIVSGAVSGIFLFRIREVRKRDRVQHDLRASELSALKAQMNPHFVFNALNSIQDYILMNQTELANDYLGKFARLMRKTLDQSQQNTVTLAEELDLLNLYLELEAIRFEDEFAYSVNVEKLLNPELTEIPAMIVQPFVENAIKHGLLHIKDDRKLSVDFKMNGTVLECRIEDNGIGLEASRIMNERRSKSHRSFGTGAAKKRLVLLNEGRKERISVEMKDVTDKAKGTSGTHVLLRIPIIKEHE